MTFKTVRRWIRRIWIAGGLAFMVFLWWSVEAHGVPDGAARSDARVRITEATFGRLFAPTASRHDMARLIFLPGGLVDPDAYVPFVRAVAEAGASVALVRLPMRAAPTEGMRATMWSRMASARTELMAAAPATGDSTATASPPPVVIGGHSRGGMFAATFAADHPDEIDGLVLIGTTHPRDRDLSAMSWPVLKIVGSADCVASPRDARANAGHLPASAAWLEIAGGNHQQFGYYGWQIGDCAATISREEQHRQTVAATVQFLRDIASPRTTE
jgi:pimeloyl-ACP methyl ester carboxylesterase